MRPEPAAVLRLTERQHSQLYRHLYPGDGKEAVAIGLCGTATGEQRGLLRSVYCIHKIEPIGYDECRQRAPDRVVWSTDRLIPILDEAARRDYRLLKIHSHPTGFPRFSEIDDVADAELFGGAAGWLDTEWPGVSALMLPDGSIIARNVNARGAFTEVSRVAVTGTDIRFFDRVEPTGGVQAFAERNAQFFGAGTTDLLSRLTIGVVGASGTGSPVCEMLVRLGVGSLVNVDPDRVEERNVNRIYNSSISDAAKRRFKVHVLLEALERIGTGVHIEAIADEIAKPAVVRRLAQCDVVIGCMDSVDGRDLLNRLAAYYSIPYLDIGIRLDADGKGGVSQVCGTVHYIQPDGSSLRSRGVYTSEQLQAAALYRHDREEYESRAREKYITGVNEDRPAVISVNTFFASLAVNELIARLHSYRDEPNEVYASVTVSLSQMRFVFSPDGAPCDVLSARTGRGDVRPLLGMPDLSER